MDEINEMLLYMVFKNASIQEMCEATGISSTSTVHMRLTNLQESGYITPPTKRKAARDRRLTQMGIDQLVARGYLKKNVGEIYIEQSRSQERN